jgi:hypothetical protein
VALTEATQELKWARDILAELGFKQETPSVVYEDNQACVAIAKNDSNTSRVKHIGKRMAFVRGAQLKGEINLVYCPTDQMAADMLIKPLSRPKFESLR